MLKSPNSKQWFGLAFSIIAGIFIWTSMIFVTHSDKSFSQALSNNRWVGLIFGLILSIVAWGRLFYVTVQD